VPIILGAVRVARRKVNNAPELPLNATSAGRTAEEMSWSLQKDIYTRFFFYFFPKFNDTYWAIPNLSFPAE